MVMTSMLFALSAFIIFWAMIGYPISLQVIGKFKRDDGIEKSYNYEP